MGALYDDLMSRIKPKASAGKGIVTSAMPAAKPAATPAAAPTAAGGQATATAAAPAAQPSASATQPAQPAPASPIDGVQANGNKYANLASTYTADERQIDPSNTVESRLAGIIDKNSPLQQRAESKAMQAMNKRGLINSSIGVGAAQTAVMDAALPIAQQDSAQALTQSVENQRASNTARGFNAGEQNKFGLQKDQQGWQSGENSTQRSWQSGENTKDRSTQMSVAKMSADTSVKVAGMNNASQEKVAGMRIEAEMKLQQMGFNQELQKMSLGQQFDLAKMAAGNEYQLSLMEEGQKLDIEKMQVQNAADLDKMVKAGEIDLAQKEKLLAVENQYSIEKTKIIAGLDTEQKKLLMEIENQYKSKALGNSVASQAMLNFTTGAADIMKDPSMSADAKAVQVNALLDRTKDTITRLGAINGVDLSDVFPPAPEAPKAEEPAPAAPKPGDPGQNAGVGGELYPG